MSYSDLSTKRNCLKTGTLKLEEFFEDFQFQERKGKLNVRSLSRLNLSKISENVDIDTLNTVVENLAFCEVKDWHRREVSGEVLTKALSTAQLIIEYLLKLQNALHKEIEENREDGERYKSELENYVLDNQLFKEENEKLKRELRQKRKALATYEYVLNAHGNNSAKELIGFGKKNALMKEKNGSCVCATCGKVFSSDDFLQKHCKRRKHLPASVKEAENEENTGAANHNSTEDNPASGKDILLQEMKTAMEEAINSRDEAVAEMESKEKEVQEKYQGQVLGLQKRVESLESELNQKHEENMSEICRSYEDKLQAMTVAVAEETNKSSEYMAKILQLESEIEKLKLNDGKNESSTIASTEEITPSLESAVELDSPTITQVESLEKVNASVEKNLLRKSLEQWKSVQSAEVPNEKIFPRTVDYSAYIQELDEAEMAGNFNIDRLSGTGEFGLSSAAICEPLPLETLSENPSEAKFSEPNECIDEDKVDGTESVQSSTSSVSAEEETEEAASGSNADLPPPPKLKSTSPALEVPDSWFVKKVYPLSPKMFQSLSWDCVTEVETC